MYCEIMFSILLAQFVKFQVFPFIFLSKMWPVLVIWQCLESFYKSCFLATRSHWHHCGESEKTTVWWRDASPTKPHKKYESGHKVFEIKSHFKIIETNVIVEAGKQAGGLLNPKVLCNF